MIFLPLRYSAGVVRLSLSPDPQLDPQLLGVAHAGEQVDGVLLEVLFIGGGGHAESP